MRSDIIREAAWTKIRPFMILVFNDMVFKLWNLMGKHSMNDNAKRRRGRITPHHICTGCFIAVAAFLWCAPAFAYVDPNAGTLLYQFFAPLLTAIVAGFMFLRRHAAAIWRSIVSLIRKFAAGGEEAGS